MRRVHTIQPGVGGMNRDVASHLIGPQNSRRAKDVVVDAGLLRRIHGWAYDGSVADFAHPSYSVMRNKFLLAGATRTVVSAPTELYIHNDAAAGTVVYQGSTVLYYMGMYRDMAMFCDPNGVEPMRFYGGGPARFDFGATGQSFTAGENTLTATTGSFGANVVPGMFQGVISPNGTGAGGPPPFYVRVLERISSTKLGLEDIIASAGGAVGSNLGAVACAISFPCVPIYSAGTLSSTGTGAGGTFAVAGGIIDGSSDWGNISVVDGVQMPVASDPGYYTVIGGPQSTGASSFDVFYHNNAITDQPWKILRPCPFKFAVAHRGSMFGTGVLQDPDTVFAGPPNWNPALPPGFVPPIDPTVAFQSDNPDDFELFPITVPSPYDGDVNVALISSSQGLRVLKGKSSHTIYGDYPNFSQRPWLSGVGCIDFRSAKTISFGAVFASREGIFLETGQTVENLCEGNNRQGGILNDWRALVDGFDPSSGDTCAVEEDQGRILVALTTDAGATDITYCYERQTGGWTSEITQHKANYFFKSNLPDEAPRLLWTSADHDGRVMDSAGAFRFTNTAKNADGTTPNLYLETTDALGQQGGIDGECLVGDVSITANLLDAGAAGTSTISVSLIHAGGIGQGASPETKTLDSIESDATDQFDRYVSTANRSGRQIQLVLNAATIGTDSAATKAEIGEITLELFDAGTGT